MNPKLEAIIVCVNYSDLLSITLPRNIEYFDKVIVVTKEDDLDTINLCKNMDKVHVVTTDAFNHNGAKFNKGLAINVGYKFLEHKEFVMNLDADILLPMNFREDFFKLNPDPEFGYGCRRFDIPTKEDLDDILNGRKSPNDYILFRGSGYGYLFITHYQSMIFQTLYHKSDGVPYPHYFSDGAESDWRFRNNWGERVFSPPLGEFPECHLEQNRDHDTGLYRELPMTCLHLGMPGKNHEKRVTEKFS